MELYKKLRHIGYCATGSIPKGWKPLVEGALIEIEKKMWPRWMPLFLKRWIHFLATGNSVVRVKYRFFHKLRNKLTNRQIITDVKEKFAGLRIYGFYGEEIEKIIHNVTEKCDETCQECGSDRNVSDIKIKNWYYRLCKECKIKNHILSS